MSIPAIPTVYNGVQFRSRLEARWAAFFDKLGWPWLYEPIDLAGYIPDFILPFPHGKVLVEVKPVLVLDDFKDEVFQKIVRSGWTDRFLLVGAALFSDFGEDFIVGPTGTIASAGADDDMGMLFRCRICDRYSLRALWGSHACLISGCYGGHIDNSPNFDPVWNEAGNVVQWRSPRA